MLCEQMRVIRLDHLKGIDHINLVAFARLPLYGGIGAKLSFRIDDDARPIPQLEQVRHEQLARLAASVRPDRHNMAFAYVAIYPAVRFPMLTGFARRAGSTDHPLCPRAAFLD